MNLETNLIERSNGMTIPYDRALASNELARKLISYFNSVINRPIIFVCIGTDRSTGDSLGPLVGTLLKEKNIKSFYIYGTLDDPIHAKNLKEKLKIIKERHFNPFIISIDACLGHNKSVGIIEIGDGPIKPGSGVKKELPAVGNIHITGTVNIGGFMELIVLQNTRLNLVFGMAKSIANGIHLANFHLQKMG